jgi:hypothetical protein
MLAQKKLADSFFAALLASLFLQAGAVSFLVGHGLTCSALVAVGSAILIARTKAAGVLTRSVGPREPLLRRRPFADSFSSVLVASLFMEAGAASFLTGHGTAAFALFSLGSSLLIARMKAAGILTRERLNLLALAVLLAAFAAELFMIYIRAHLGVAGDSAYAAADQTPGPSTGKYRGVILWQDVKPPDILVPPRPGAGRGIPKGKQLLTIPFDGVYWFYKFPDRQPPRNSYVTRGSPSATTFRSADSIPLQMEARQNFITPIEMNCCSRMTVEILNADHAPGTLAIELILANLGLPGEPSQSLGVAQITSAPQALGGGEFQPVSEVLTFTFPANPRISQFDSARVRFLRSGRRGASSAKISIQQFTLAPRGL